MLTSGVDPSAGAPGPPRSCDPLASRVSLRTFGITMACLVAVTLATLCRWPLVWCDEPYFVDPSFHLAKDGVLASEISDRRPRELEPPPLRIWAGNCPLYSIVLGYWIRWTGFSLFGARLLGVLLYSTAVVFIALALGRLGLLESVRAQILLPVLMFSCYSLVFEYRQCRYDTLCILESAALFYGATIRGAFARRWFLAAVASLVPWSGFPAVAWIGALFLVAAALFGSRLFLDGVAVGGGMAVGLVALLSWLWKYEALAIFAHHVVSVQERVAFSLRARAGLLLKNLLEERGRMALWCATLALLFARVRRQRLRIGSPAMVATLCSLFGAVVLVVATSRAYSWMIAIPLIVGIVVELGASPPAGVGGWGARIAVAFTFAAAMGLPGVLLASAYEWRERDAARVDSFVKSQMSPEDVAFIDITGYFAARPIARRVLIDFGTLYTVGTWGNVEEESRFGVPFSVIVVRAERSERTIEEFGGKWREVARLPHVEPTWQDGSSPKRLLKTVVDIVYPPPLDDDPDKRIATDRMYDLVALRPVTSG